jgi:molybdate transport system permease protein
MNPLDSSEFSAIVVSVTVGLGALALMFVPGVAIGWLLARRNFRGKIIVETLAFLPLVLPPVVTGYVLLVMFGRRGVIGGWLYDQFGIEIAFTWTGMALASAVVGFPLMVRSVRMAMEAVPAELERAALTLGCSRWEAFLSVTLPLAWPGIVTGALLAFARALGEFGATRMMALNADGTRTIALEVFQLMETPGAAESAVARLALISIALSGGALVCCEWLGRRQRGIGL